MPNVLWMGKKVSQLPVIESENLCDNIELTMMIAWENLHLGDPIHMYLNETCHGHGSLQTDILLF